MVGLTLTDCRRLAAPAARFELLPLLAGLTERRHAHIHDFRSVRFRAPRRTHGARSAPLRRAWGESPAAHRRPPGFRGDHRGARNVPDGGWDVVRGLPFVVRAGACGGREWRLPDDSRRELRELTRDREWRSRRVA